MGLLPLFSILVLRLPFPDASAMLSFNVIVNFSAKKMQDHFNFGFRIALEVEGSIKTRKSEVDTMNKDNQTMLEVRFKRGILRQFLSGASREMRFVCCAGF